MPTNGRADGLRARRPGVLSEAEGKSGRRGDSPGWRILPPVSWWWNWSADRVKNNQASVATSSGPVVAQVIPNFKACRSARVLLSGLAYNHLTLNGKPTSDSVLDPSFTDYSKTVLYTTRDVTVLLRQVENVIASELGSGHFDVRRGRGTGAGNKRSGARHLAYDSICTHIPRRY